MVVVGMFVVGCWGLYVWGVHVWRVWVYVGLVWCVRWGGGGAVQALGPGSGDSWEEGGAVLHEAELTWAVQLQSGPTPPFGGCYMVLCMGLSHTCSHLGQPTPHSHLQLL